MRRRERGGQRRSAGRATRIVAGCAVVGCAVAVACGGAAPDRAPELATLPAPAPATPTPAPTLDPLLSTEPPIGVQLFEADVDTPALEHLRGAGVAWARVRALWKLVEPERRTPPRHDWTVTDRMFAATTAAGFRNVAVVYANPPWLTERECLPVPPGDLGRYAALWGALVERYDGDGDGDAPGGGVVRHWQVSNEVDFDPTATSDEGDYGGCFGHDPAAYAEQLVVAYRAAKAADPGAQVGFGPVAYDRFTPGSAPEGWSAPPGPFVHDFTQRALEHLYAAHAGDPGLPFFDFVGLHNYNDNAHFWDGGPRPLRSELVGKVAAFRAEQLALPGVFDVRGVPVMVSETGLASSPSDEWTARGEDLQAVYVGQTMVRAMAAGVVAAVWYTARDNIFGDCAPPHYDWLTFGLMRSSDYRAALDARCPIHPWIDAYPLDSPATPRPALAALGIVTGALRGLTFDRQLDPAATGDAAVEAYAFRGAGGRAAVAAWTTTGERLGRRGVDPLAATLVVNGATVAPWTGRVVVTDHLGAARTLGAAGDAAVPVALGQAPVFVAPAP